MAELIAEANGSSMSGRRSFAPALSGIAAVFAALLMLSCGTTTVTNANGMFIVARVEEQRSDGAWMPAANARVHFQIWAGQTFNSQVSLYQEFDATTNADGVAAELRDPQGKSPGEIGMVFVEAVHADGRTAFQRKQVAMDFDFAEFIRSFDSGDAGADSGLDIICGAASGFKNCQKAIKSGDFKAWGGGVLLRFSPGS